MSMAGTLSIVGRIVTVVMIVSLVAGAGLASPVAATEAADTSSADGVYVSEGELVCNWVGGPSYCVWVGTTDSVDTDDLQVDSSTGVGSWDSDGAHLGSTVEATADVDGISFDGETCVFHRDLGRICLG